MSRRNFVGRIAYRLTGDASMTDVLQDDLRTAAERVRAAEKACEQERQELRRLVLMAANEGLPLALIARVTERSRETIYRDLERARKEDG